MNATFELQLVTWALTTLVSTVIGVLALRKVMDGLHDPELNSSRYGPVYRAMLRGNLLQQLLRLLADFACWAAAALALLNPPPSAPPAQDAQNGAVTLLLLGLRLIITINSGVDYFLNAVWLRDAKYESERWAAARREHRALAAAIAAGTAPQPPPAVEAAGVEDEDDGLPESELLMDAGPTP